MNIVHQLHLIPDPVTDLSEQLYRIPDIFPAVQIHAVRSAFRSRRRCAAVVRSAVSSALTAQMSDAHLLILQDIFTDLINILSVHVPVHRDAFPHLAAEKLIDRHACHLSLDVPQRHINSGYGIVLDGTVSPVSVLMHELPEFFNVLCIPSHEQRFEIFLHQMLHGQMTVREGGAAQSIQPRLIRIHLHHHQIDSLGSRADDPDVFDQYCHLLSSFSCYSSYKLYYICSTENNFEALD